ncbi:hypothetical protein E2562_012867 [Oryza meyeriana var. granulata]|uniref:Uncharacterized protein n=1 Tax=Oryza meyeriana var. granulata TaxID=110450 RepID=A0A6G1CPT5_9ORYZ|nr:hypothetical protein E2562_012867 [Oryza meyeriana var. granulata]
MAVTAHYIDDDWKLKSFLSRVFRWYVKIKNGAHDPNRQEEMYGALHPKSSLSQYVQMIWPAKAFKTYKGTCVGLSTVKSVMRKVSKKTRLSYSVNIKQFINHTDYE